MLERFKQAAAALKRELGALALACRDPRTPWYAKALVLLVIAYAASPIDLIPDPIPIVGYLDDLLLLPLGIALALRMIPADVMKECRERAGESALNAGALSWIVTGFIVVLWMGMAALLARLVWS